MAHLSRDSPTSISPVAEDTLSELEETLAKQLDGIKLYDRKTDARVVLLIFSLL